MRVETLALMCCPGCQGELAFEGQVREDEILEGRLTCVDDGAVYPIEKGIPHFVTPESLEGLDRGYRRLYDLIARFYDSQFFVARNTRRHFFPAGEEKARREVIERLELDDSSRVLETGLGTGSNIPYLVEKAPQADIYGMDISLGMLRQCGRHLKKWGVASELMLANGEALPFKDDTFDVVFHVGGINAFTEIERAVDEMVRVAKPGTRIVIADETEEVVDGFFSRVGFHLFFGRQLAEEILAFRADDMMGFVPDGMQEVRFASTWEGKGYLLEFRKPA